ncbi:MAG: hypothetical protein HYY32_03175 [Chloroflexi bacterium]|nr:hypothetical protein [Chloroflexota bacterium]
MKGEPLAVFIITGRTAYCDAGCGLDWSVRDNQEAAKAEASARFGGKVALAFCDAGDADCPAPQELLARARAGSVPLPLLAINGAPRITGDFDMRMMWVIVEAALEMNGD